MENNEIRQALLDYQEKAIKRLDLVQESNMARQERTIKRLIIALIFSIALMFATNALWLIAWTSYDFAIEGDETTSTTDIDGENGSVNYIGEDGDIINGTGKSDKNNAEIQSNAHKK